MPFYIKYHDLYLCDIFPTVWEENHAIAINYPDEQTARSVIELCCSRYYHIQSPIGDPKQPIPTALTPDDFETIYVDD